MFTPEEFYGADTGHLPEASEGVCRMLQESGHQFDFIDSTENFSKYKVLILPDVIPVSEEFGRRLQQYLDNGGSIIASFESGLNPEKTRFALPAWGVRYKGNAPYSPDFIVPSGDIGSGLKQAEHVMYKQGAWVEAEGGENLADAIESVFNRSFEHFSSHLHSPSSGKVGYPAIVKKGRVIYFIHPVFGQYHDNAPLWVKTLVRNALNMLLPDPLLKHNGPSTMLATVNEQAAENRQVVHLLHYIPERRSKMMDIIEDVIPLHDTHISVKVDRDVTGVSLVPDNKPLDYEVKDGRIEFLVPKITGHQMVELSFGK